MIDSLQLMKGKFSHHFLPPDWEPGSPNYQALFKVPAAVLC